MRRRCKWVKNAACAEQQRWVTSREQRDGRSEIADNDRVDKREGGRRGVQPAATLPSQATSGESKGRAAAVHRIKVKGKGRHLYGATTAAAALLRHRQSGRAAYTP